MLLVKDAHSMLWGFPGGGIEPGESHDDALHRECMEETGLTIRGAATYIAQQNSDARQRFFYRIEGVEGNLGKQGNNDDILEAAYFSAKNLPPDMAAGVEKIIVQQIA